jgi:tetratricopeptide (TPR) repeat protein/DNA polymerase III delta prime subunit
VEEQARGILHAGFEKEGLTMARTIMKYNPAFLKPEELVDSFVVRYGELETIIRIIKENITKSNQHILVIGPRGIGKTMLVLRAAEEVKRDDQLNKKWYPLVFSEESYSVVTCGEFWLESLFHLAHQTEDQRWQKTYEELLEEKDEKRLRERALAQLMDFADKQGKRILLVVENLNMLLGDQLSDDEAWSLRHTLLNEPRVMLLASATSRFEQVNVEGKPMFELFRFLELKPLNKAECRELWSWVTGNRPDDARVRPLEILTGGNPRLMAIVSNFAAKMSLKNLMNDLMQLVDEHTEYFKSHLDNLPPVERKVYLALAEIWDPASARKVANVARLDVNKTSSLLARLIERGAVVEANSKGKIKLYQVAERMYNIYYLMRKRGETPQRVRALVNFMTSFYGVQELIGVVKSIAEEACQLAPSDRGDHYTAYGGILKKVKPETMKIIIANTPRDFFETPTMPDSLKKLLSACNNLVDGLEQKKLIKRILKDIEKSESLKMLPGELGKEETYFREFINDHPKDSTAWVALGSFLSICKGHLEEAEKAYREATRINPKDEFAWRMLGNFLKFRLQNFEDAEMAYKKSLEIDPLSAETWQALGLLLSQQLSRYKEAEDAMRKAVEINPNDAQAWNNFALSLQNTGKAKEAEEAFRRAMKLEKEPAPILVHLGLLFLQQARLSESEECFRKAIELDKKQHMALLSLVLLMAADTSRHEEWQKLLKELVKNAEAIKGNVEIATNLFILIAAGKYEHEALEILRESAWAETLEPVVVALRLMAGEDVKAAAEIMEVAKDVVKRIEETKKQIESAKKSDAKK